jgi:hypothetical protein
MALMLDLLALIDDPLPLPAVLEPRLQPDRPEQLIIGHALYGMLLVSMRFHVLAALAAETATPALEPIDDGDDGLPGQPVRWQRGCQMIVFPRQEQLHVLLGQLPGGLSGLVDLAHVLDNAGGADCFATPAVDA